MPTVRNTSVVLVAPSPIDTQSIKPEALASAKVAPSNWVVTNQLSTPVLALTQYQNGFSVRVEGNRCVFQEAIGEPLRADYEIHPIARRYLEATKLVSYNAVGINWLLVVAVDQPAEWIGEQLSCGERFPGFLPTSIQLAKPWGPAVCNLVFRVEQQTVVVDCNYHFPLGSSLQPMAALDHWRQCQKALIDDVLPTLPD